jgi:2-phospho-L-lactate guanylyltransferase
MASCPDTRFEKSPVSRRVGTADGTATTAQRSEKPDGFESYWAVIPVKNLSRAKGRLKSRLGPDRADFTLAMLCDLLDALAGSRKVSHVALVTADSRVAEFAAGYDVLLVDEGESQGMSQAIMMGIDAARQSGGRHFALLPADLPLLTASEVDRVLNLLDTQRRARGGNIIGICPSKDRGGTNILCIEDGQNIELKYGPNSYELHKESAIAGRARPVSLGSEAISLDIDEPRDLDDFIAHCRANSLCRESETWKFLHKKGYISDEPVRPGPQRIEN